MVRKRRPASPVAKNFVPDGNLVPYRVIDGDSWDSIAAKFSLRTWFLIEYNFPTLRSVAVHQQKCEEVNRYLYENVGCRSSKDGKNYSFSSLDNPGLVYIPIFPDVPKVESYFVPGTLRRVVPQLDLLCWAAAATIMMSWKDVKPYSFVDAIGIAGEPWLTRYKNREGLPWTKTAAFLADAGMNGGVFPCSDPQVWMKVLKSKVPVAAAQFVSEPWDHMVVVYGIFMMGGSTTVYVMEPGEMGGKATIPFDEFIDAYEKSFRGRAKISVWFYGSSYLPLCSTCKGIPVTAILSEHSGLNLR